MVGVRAAVLGIKMASHRRESAGGAMTVEDWLQSIGLEQYVGPLITNG